MAKKKIAEAGVGFFDDVINSVRRIGDSPALPNQPSIATIPNVGRVEVGPDSSIMALAKKYADENNISFYEVMNYMRLNPDFSAQVAREYDLMRHAPDDPAVKKAYSALIDETANQYESMLSAGIKPYFIKGADPYADSPYLSLLDMTENKRLGVFPTRSGFGSDDAFDPAGNPLMAETEFKLDGEPMLANDLFRAVHDYFGHGKGGFGFRGMGEENAYRAHSGMYSPEAARAAGTETRGQNSWLNYGPYGEQNRSATIGDTVFADQKTGLLPNWATTQGTPRGEARRNDFFRSLEGIGERDLSGLRGAVTEDGTLKLVHYSRQPVDRIDPSQYGKGLSGRTISERNRSYDPDFQNRSYYGIEGSDNPYKKEMGLGNFRNETEIPVEQMYDIQADPLNLESKIDSSIRGADRTTQLEKLINEQGFSGYFTRGANGDVAAIFDPLDVGKTHKFAISGLGAGGLAAVASGASNDAMASPVDDLRTSEAQWDMTPEERAIADLRASEEGFVPASNPQWESVPMEGLASALGALKGNKNYQNFENIAPFGTGLIDYGYNVATGSEQGLLDYIFAGGDLAVLPAPLKKAAKGLIGMFK